MKQELDKTKSALLPPTPAPTSKNPVSDFAKYIVVIVCSNGNETIQGSGTIFGLNRLILTNAHVVQNMTTCSFGLTDNIKNSPQNWYDATVLSSLQRSSDPNILSDLALIKPITPLSQTVKTVAYNLCSSNDILLGSELVILGYPAIGGYTITATEGIVSGFDQGGFVVKTSAKIEHGNSGGGAFLKNKDCWFGIPTEVAQGDLESLGYIINYSRIHEYIHQ